MRHLTVNEAQELIAKHGLNSVLASLSDACHIEAERLWESDGSIATGLRSIGIGLHKLYVQAETLEYGTTSS